MSCLRTRFLGTPPIINSSLRLQCIHERLFYLCTSSEDLKGPGQWESSRVVDGDVVRFNSLQDP